MAYRIFVYINVLMQQALSVYSGEYLPASYSIYSLPESATTVCQENDYLSSKPNYPGTDVLTDQVCQKIFEFVKA